MNSSVALSNTLAPLRQSQKAASDHHALWLSFSRRVPLLFSCKLGGQGLLFLHLAILHRLSHKESYRDVWTMTKARSYRGADVDVSETAHDGSYSWQDEQLYHHVECYSRPLTFCCMCHRGEFAANCSPCARRCSCVILTEALARAHRCTKR